MEHQVYEEEEPPSPHPLQRNQGNEYEIRKHKEDGEASPPTPKDPGKESRKHQEYGEA